MRCHSERWACPRSGLTSATKASLRRRETEENGEGFWDAEELDGRRGSGRATGVACQPFFPREAIMGALRPGKDDFWAVWRRWRNLRKCDLNPLVAQ